METDLNKDALHYKMEEFFEETYSSDNETFRDWSTQIATSKFMDYLDEISADTIETYGTLTGIYSEDTPSSFIKYYCQQYLDIYKEGLEGNSPPIITLH